MALILLNSMQVSSLNGPVMKPLRLFGCMILSLAALQNQALAQDICAKAASHAGRQIGAPNLLLPAIALAESGKYDRETGQTRAWPWTVMAEGQGRYLPTKQAAIAEVERLQAKGVRNIDVGCMQVNLHFHPGAFDTLQEAFDPNLNAAYASEFLQKLHLESGSWTRAAAHYHSRTKRLAANYKAKVVTLWRQLSRAEAIAKARAQSRGPQSGRVKTSGSEQQAANQRRSAVSWREEQVTRYLLRKGNNNL